MKNSWYLSRENFEFKSHFKSKKTDDGFSQQLNTSKSMRLNSANQSKRQRNLHIKFENIIAEHGLLTVLKRGVNF